MVIVKIRTSSNTDVVHIDVNCRPQGFMFEDGITVDKVPHRLECCGGIGESEIHDCGFEKTVSGFKCGLLFITFTDLYVIVSPPDIEFGIYVGIAEIAYE